MLFKIKDINIYDIEISDIFTTQYEYNKLLSKLFKENDYINESEKVRSRLILLFSNFLNELDEGTTISLTKLLLDNNSRGGLILSKNISNSYGVPSICFLLTSTSYTDTLPDPAINSLYAGAI